MLLNPPTLSSDGDEDEEFSLPVVGSSGRGWSTEQRCEAATPPSVANTSCDTRSTERCEASISSVANSSSDTRSTERCEASKVVSAARSPTEGPSDARCNPPSVSVSLANSSSDWRPSECFEAVSVARCGAGEWWFTARCVGEGFEAIDVSVSAV